MAKNILQLNYDELTAIAKKFKDEGEDMVKLHSATRQRVRDLYKEWIGEAANKFFEEMENELLPALQRLAAALFFSQDVVSDIMKIVHETDEETANFFKNDDFGASGFQSASGGMGGPSGPDDFGAGKFDEALGGVSGGGSSASDDFGAGQFEDARPGQGSESAGGQGVPEQTGQPAQEGAATEPMTGGAGGAGGGSGSSSGQGMQGDLKGMGVGSSQAQQGVAGGEAGGARSGAMADHVYSGSASGSSSGESQAPAGGGSPGEGGQSSSGGGEAAAAGAAGVVGAAAAGGAAKVVKDQREKDD